MFKLSNRSIKRLRGVHEDLCLVVNQAIILSEVDFFVISGVRTKEEQQILFDNKATGILNSRHLTGHAVDLGALVGNKASWAWPHYYLIADAMKEAAAQVNVIIEWGGDWKKPDGPHFQLPWSVT